LDKGEINNSVLKDNVKDRLKLLGLPHCDLDQLFDLLDVDGTGVLPIRKYFRGCERVRGPAQACDVYSMNTEMQRCCVHAQEMIEYSQNNVNKRLQQTMKSFKTIEEHVIVCKADEKDPVRIAFMDRVKRQEDRSSGNHRLWNHADYKIFAVTGWESKTSVMDLCEDGFPDGERAHSQQQRRPSLMRASLYSADEDRFEMPKPPPQPPPIEGLPPLPPSHNPEDGSRRSTKASRASRNSSKGGLSRRGSFQWRN